LNISLNSKCLQKDFAKLVGVSEAAVSGMISRGVIEPEQTLGQWLLSYCSHLREQAAGRDGHENSLAAARTRLANAQEERINMQNAITRREYGPIEALEHGVSDVMARVASQLDTIPGRLRIASDKLTAEDLNLVASVIAKVRNEIADMNIDWFGDKTTQDDDIDVDLED
jgi:phage terminase Nu1 subunit (DNA packaging protein)